MTPEEGGVGWSTTCGLKQRWKKNKRVLKDWFKGCNMNKCFEKAQLEVKVGRIQGKKIPIILQQKYEPVNSKRIQDLL